MQHSFSHPEKLLENVNTVHFYQSHRSFYSRSINFKDAGKLTKMRSNGKAIAD